MGYEDNPGLAGRLLRTLMRPPAAAYGLVGLLRRSLWRAGVLSPKRVGVPVISVGNLTAGGTGKTPMAAWVVDRLKSHGRKPAILSRGYRAMRNESGTPVNDETLVLRRLLPEVPQYVDPDRVRSGRRAVADGADCLVLDDGFQHLRLARDMDIVLLDAMNPFGGGRMIPSGTLREPVSALRDADVCVLTRVDAVDRAKVEMARALLRRLAPYALLCEARHAPITLAPLTPGPDLALDALAGMRVGIFCGIGNPEGFRRTVSALGPTIAAAHFLPDHFAYPQDSLDRIASDFAAQKVALALTTEKDAVKLDRRWPGEIPLHVLRIAMTITDGADRIEELLAKRASR